MLFWELQFPTVMYVFMLLGFELPLQVPQSQRRQFPE
jgi:hypothetical protein